jgi:site-specific DNA recombinase
MPRKKKSRVGVYLRCSTSHQTLAIQRQQVMDFVEQHSDWAVAKVYSDHGESGAKASRPALDELLKDCRAGKVDVIVCKSICRFARSLSFFVTSIAELRELEIEFYTVQERIQLDGSPTSMLLTNLLALLADFERSLIHERCMAGLEKAKAEGRLGRKRVAFDFARALAMRKDGASYKAIAEAVGVSVGTVHNYLSAAS